MIVYARSGDTLDLLCWRHLKTTADVVEAALELNPGIARLGPVLPEGLSVKLPEAPSAAPRQTVALWD
jgi:phage tail protein X